MVSMKSGSKYHPNTAANTPSTSNQHNARTRRCCQGEKLCVFVIFTVLSVHQLRGSRWHTALHRRLTDRQIDQRCSHPQGNNQVPHHVVIALAVVQVAP